MVKDKEGGASFDERPIGHVKVLSMYPPLSKVRLGEKKVRSERGGGALDTTFALSFNE